MRRPRTLREALARPLLKERCKCDEPDFPGRIYTLIPGTVIKWNLFYLIAWLRISHFDENLNAVLLVKDASLYVVNVNEAHLTSGSLSSNTV